QGVDVLAGVCPAMDTPTFRRNHDIDIPGIFNPEEVVATLLDRLPDGPTHIFAFGPDAPNVPALEKARRQRVVAVSEITKKIFRQALILGKFRYELLHRTPVSIL